MYVLEFTWQWLKADFVYKISEVE